ncbi:MAG: hypothetical protein NZ929_04520 [Aigarchaeota archaeon]|nr:hypothetical protein [Aigarchaeota archaeon]MCX8193532.1 hypothetical protein [Nitrososphaeria archaeon]MDW7986672.1 hypothetical protein [Nitrososphaerota archaeon]
MLLEQPKMSLRRSYANGYKYCSRCRVYYLTESVRCPYCGILLRNSPRKKKSLRNTKTVKVTPELEKETAKLEVTVKST